MNSKPVAILFPTPALHADELRGCANRTEGCLAPVHFCVARGAPGVRCEMIHSLHAGDRDLTRTGLDDGMRSRPIAAAVVAALELSACSSVGATHSGSTLSTANGIHSIRHVVVIMQENRSF